MAIKRKISKLKQNTKLTNKFNKKNKLKRNKNNKQQVKNKAEPVNTITEEENEESDLGEDMLGMVDDSDLKFLKQAVLNNSYTIYNQVRCSNATNRNNRKRKATDDEDVYEKHYEREQVSSTPVKNLLPIKTKQGIIPRTIVDEDENEKQDEEEEKEEENDNDFEDDNDEPTFELLSNGSQTEPLPTINLLANRQNLLRDRKIQIGTLSSGLLENPQEKMRNFKTLLAFMDEKTPVIYFTVRKLATVSLLEIFKDLLPGYEIKHQEQSNVKLKKETRVLKQYETEMLQHYKNYLVRLEKFIKVTRGGNTQRSQDEYKLAELGVQSLCDLLITHPYFNYAQNIAQVLVPLLNNRLQSVRDLVNRCCKTVFKEDKRGEITLKIVRIMNNYLKTHAHNVHVAMLDILLVLKIKDINLDKEKEQEINEKKLMAKKQRMLKLSKKQRKHNKRLQELEKELLETKAEENKESKQKHLTEITKLTFGIYFRILKSSNNTKVLGVCLEGLAKFATCINLEFYSDLVNVLNKILKEPWLGYREQLHCIQTVLVILSGQGEALNLDPTRFYKSLYENLLRVHAGRTHNDMSIVIETLALALIKRRKKVTQQRLISFTKRLATLSLQLLHNGTLACLATVKNLLQTSKGIDVLLDLDTSVGVGNYQPEIMDPEYCNASNAALFELVPLMKHYHPTVCRVAKHILNGVPSTGAGSLSVDLAKISGEQFYQKYDPSQVTFEPAVPVRSNQSTKSNRGKMVVNFADAKFQEYCSGIVQNSVKKDKQGFYFAI